MNRILIVLTLMAVLSGCKTTELQYHHGEYNKAVYSFFRGDEMSLEEQITVLREVITTAATKNKPVAPGIHAHLGMLYFESGANDLGMEHFNMEKKLFPESTQYIDFLIASGKEA